MKINGGSRECRPSNNGGCPSDQTVCSRPNYGQAFEPEARWPESCVNIKRSKKCLKKRAKGKCFKPNIRRKCRETCLLCNFAHREIAAELARRNQTPQRGSGRPDWPAMVTNPQFDAEPERG